MAEYASLPARLNGAPIPHVSDVQVQQTRAMSQKGTTDGVKIVYGPPKYQVTITFPTMRDRLDFLQAVGAFELQPTPHNFGFDLGLNSFACLNGIPSGVTASSNQDGEASLQITAMYEDFVVEG